MESGQQVEEITPDPCRLVPGKKSTINIKISLPQRKEFARMCRLYEREYLGIK